MALKEMDESLLNENAVESLNREYIKPDELAEYKKYPPSTLFNSSENFLIALYNIDNSKEKLEIWQFINTFPSELESMKNMLKTNKEAISTLHKNESITLLFSYILSFGNILNGGTNKGQADGFGLDILPKLTQIKNNDNQTLLQCIVQQIVKQKKENFGNFSKKYECLKSAFALPFNDMVKNWSVLKKDFLKISKHFVALKNKDRFKVETGKFIEKNEKELNNVDNDINKLKTSYTELCEYYAIDDKDKMYTQPEMMFKLFSNFFDDVDASMPVAPTEKKVFKPKHTMGAKIGGNASLEQQKKLMQSMRKIRNKI